MRIFKTKSLSRFAKRERISDARLRLTIDDAQRGLIEADLGGGIIKQRVAREGEGKRGGYRMLVAFRHDDLAIFVFGFAKKDVENIDESQLTTLREIAAFWFAADRMKIDQAVRDGTLVEVADGSKNKNKT